MSLSREIQGSTGLGMYPENWLSEYPADMKAEYPDLEKVLKCKKKTISEKLNAFHQNQLLFSVINLFYIFLMAFSSSGLFF